MAYETSNPPYLVTQGIGNQGVAVWHYDDDDASTTVRVSGYITNAKDLGMKVGDMVVHHDLSAETLSTYRVDAILTDGSADLADATVIGSATDSD